MANSYQTAETLWDSANPCPYSAVLDARSPAEFAEDRVPGAVNLPVLSDAERAEVGTLYAAGEGGGAFAARRLGAGLVSANIARHFAGYLADRPRDFRPLVYCWRGGQRSASLATVLSAVGWRVTVLKGGYKTYRAHVRRRLEELLPGLDYRLVGGATGTGKTKLLGQLAARGAQVLDLEALANHRGSALGNVGPQPAQKWFESQLLRAVERFDPARVVWVEAESCRVGNVYLPPALWGAMKVAGGVELRAPVPARVELLVAEYAGWVADPARLLAALAPFAKWHGPRRVAAWGALIGAGDFAPFVADLLAQHYDPRYAASAGASFPNVVEVADLAGTSDAELGGLAARLVAAEAPHRVAVPR